MTNKEPAVKIAFIKQKFVKFGGGEGYLVRLMNACAAEGDEVHLITTAWQAEENRKIKLHLVPRRGRTPGTRASNFSRAAAEVLERRDFDVSFSLERTEHQDVWRAGEGVHQVWLERRQLFQPRFKTLLNNRTARHKTLLNLEANCVQNTPLIISNSEMVKNDIETVYGDNHGRIEVIYNGVDPKQFNLVDREANRRRIRESLKISDECGMLLFAGSGFLRKGLHESIAALARLPECVMIVLGRDKTTKWKRLAAGAGVSDRIVFMEPQSELRAWFHAVDLVMLPSWFDPFPNVGLESLFCGTPLLTSRYAGVHEVVEPGGNGEVIDSPADIDAMVAGVERELRMERDESDAVKIAESVKKFTIENNRKKTLAVIRKRSN